MFKKPEPKPPISFFHKLITMGMILFFFYFYLTDFQTKQAEKELLTKKILADKIKANNLISGEILLVDPKTPGKVTISLNKVILQQKIKLAKGDNIDVVEITVPEAPAAPANLTKQ